MKVMDIKAGGIIEVNDSYGARLIEQGRALPVAEKKSRKSEKPAPTTEPEEKPSGKRK